MPQKNDPPKLTLLEGIVDPMVKFSGRMLESEYKVAGEMAELMFCSKAEVFRRGIRLLERVWLNEREGGRMLLEDPEGKRWECKFRPSPQEKACEDPT